MYDWRKELEELTQKHDKYIVLSSGAVKYLQDINNCLTVMNEELGRDTTTGKDSLIHLMEWFSEDSKKFKDFYKEKMGQFKDLQEGEK